MNKDPQGIGVGLASWVGLALTFLAAAPLWIGQLADATEPLGVSPRVWVIATLVIGAVTVVGRMLQAAVAIYQQWATSPDFVPVAPEPIEDVEGGVEPE